MKKLKISNLQGVATIKGGVFSNHTGCVLCGGGGGNGSRICDTDDLSGCIRCVDTSADTEAEGCQVTTKC
ncbi:MAG: hypothetical protein AAF617_16630 [Bacteroidota bacterium]